MKKILLLTTLLVGFANAQNNQQPQQNQNQNDQQRLAALEEKLKEMESDGVKRFWLCNVRGSEIMIAVDRISAISKTQYILDGAFIVDEVVIETTGGQALNRIYCGRPITDATGANAAKKIVDRVREVATERSERMGANLTEMVQKNYPTTTHARTVELRVAEPADLDVLYASVKNTWITGRGRVFTIK